MVRAIKEKVNLLWLTDKIIRIKARIWELLSTYLFVSS